MKKILILFSVLSSAHAFAQSVVINEVYGAGGNAGAVFRNDYVELFNAGSTAVSLTGWSLQYASATATGTWQVTPLIGSLQSGRHYLIQLAGGTAGLSLPAPDVLGTISMSATAGKVALVTSTAALSGGCPISQQIADRVGYGTSANCFEGSAPTPAPSALLAVERKVSGLDSDDNASDFRTASPNPQNSRLQEQVITFAPPGAHQYGDGPFELTAFASSGLPVTLGSSNNSVATIFGTTVTIHSAGETTITANQAGNMEFDPAPVVTHVLTVNKKSLSVTAVDTTKIYGDALPELRVRYSGFFGLENASVLDALPTANTTATAQSAVGNYNIVLSGGSDNNYDFAYTQGTLSITQATLIATAEDKAKFSGEPNPQFTIAYAGFRGDDDPTSIDEMPLAHSSADEFSPPGEYPIFLSAAKDENYALSLVDGKLLVTNPPGMPDVYVTTPMHGTEALPISISLTARGVSNALMYTIQLSTSPDFKILIEKNGGRTQRFNFLAYNTKYYARVRTNLSTAFGRITFFTTGRPEQFTFVTSPGANTTGIGLAPIITSSTITGAVAYTIELNTAPDFSGLSRQQTGSRSQKFTGLMLSTVYYTRVKTDLSPEWGPVRFFTTGSATDLSYVTTPADKAVNVSWLPVLTVNDIGATDYTLQISSSEDFSNVLEMQGMSNKFNVSTSLNYDTRYYARVRSNLSGEFWGPVRTFTTGNPTAFAFVTLPANGATNVNYSTNVTVNRVPGAGGYTIELNPDSNFDPVSKMEKTGTSRAFPFILQPGILYYSRVKTDLSETWGPIRNFTTGDALSLAYITSPTSGAVNVNFETTVLAQNIPGALFYVIELNTSLDFSGPSVIKTAATRSIKFSLSQNETYYGRVKTDLHADWGATVRSFTTGTAVSLAFVTSPKHGGVDVPTDVKVYSNVVGTAAQYTIELNTSSDFTGTGIVKTGNSRVIHFDGLASGTKFYSRVKTSLAPDSWGEIRSFTTVENKGLSAGARMRSDWMGEEGMEEEGMEEEGMEEEPVTASAGVVVLDEASDGLKVYPNPFRHTLTLIAGEERTKNTFVRIVDLTGREVFSGEFSAGSRRELGGDWGVGVYVLQVVRDNKVIAVRLVKY